MKDLLLTCEHAGNDIPKFLKDKLVIPKKILSSHRGYDKGAHNIFKVCEKVLKTKGHSFHISRLVIEGNRPLIDSGLFSKYSSLLEDRDKQKLISMHSKHWNKARSFVSRKNRVFHFGIHTFTPVLKGEKRLVDLGILFDPKNILELKVAKKLKKHLDLSGLNVAFNKPYSGTSPGLTTTLRGEFKNYSGIEIEVNQRFTRQKRFKEVSFLVANAIKDCLIEFN